MYYVYPIKRMINGQIKKFKYGPLSTIALSPVAVSYSFIPNYIFICIYIYILLRKFQF